MNMSNITNKQNVVGEIVENIKKFSNLFVVENHGLSANDLVSLRRELKKKNMKINVYKNSFVLRALSELKIKFDDIRGPNIFVFSEDELSCSNLLFNFSKKNEKLVIKSGYINNEIMKSDKINMIANLPSKENLILMFLGCLRMSVIKFLYVVSELAKNKGD